jgi:bifunctional non-homologous end joining protein LigD
MTGTGRQVLPGQIRPMLATLGGLPPDTGGWAFEMKWDGVRAIAFVEGGRAQFWSRTGRDVTGSYPELYGLAAAVGTARVVLDGEVVAFGDGQWPSFEALQQRINISSPAQIERLAAEVPVSYLAFDLLCLDGQPLLDAPYSERRALLDELGLDGRHWQTPPSFTDVAGADLLKVAEQQGLEGVVAKRLTSRYEPGRRSPAWRKVKVRYRQEAVVGGWTRGEGNRAGLIGSLLVGVQGPAGLNYAGHVGTGFTLQTLTMLGQRLEPLRRKTSPFAVPVPPEHARAAIWVEPRLVVDVEFGGWTSADIMRAAAYKGLRNDKDPADVVRET